MTFVLLLIKFYGATNTEIVKSLRKVLSIALSFLIYPKPLNAKYVAGMAATVGSLVLSFRLKRRKHVRLSACPSCARDARADAPFLLAVCSCTHRRRAGTGGCLSLETNNRMHNHIITRLRSSLAATDRIPFSLQCVERAWWAYMRDRQLDYWSTISHPPSSCCSQLRRQWCVLLSAAVPV